MKHTKLNIILEQYLSNLDAERLYRSNVVNLVRHPPSVLSTVPSSGNFLKPNILILTNLMPSIIDNYI